MKKLFLLILLGVLIMTNANANAQDLSKLTPWQTKYNWLGEQEDVELTFLESGEHHVRLYKKDAVSQGGYLPDELSIYFEDVFARKQIPLSESKELVEMAKKNNHYYYTTTPSSSYNDDTTNSCDENPFDHLDEPTFAEEYLLNSKHIEYIIIGKESVFHFITDKEPQIYHEYGIMDRIPDDMLEEIMNNREQE